MSSVRPSHTTLSAAKTGTMFSVTFIGSDAQRFAPPTTFDRRTQVPVLRRFLACDERFAELAYDDGLRWLSAGDGVSPDTHLDWYLQRHGTVGAYWLRDIWSGREIYPGPSLPRTVAEFDRIVPRNDGSPGVSAFVPPYFTPAQREIDKLRDTVRVRAPSGYRHITYDIPVWKPEDRSELDEILSELRLVAASLSDAPVTLWFRGQTSFYEKLRDPLIARWLDIPEKDLSLVPSIARPGAGAMPSDPDEARAWAWSYDYVWRAPLISWFAEQPGYRPIDSSAVQTLDHLTDNVIGNLAEALILIQEDPHLDALDDLRQWLIMGPGRFLALPLWFQHYGARTTMLDLTSDIEVALYFARRSWVGTSSEFRSIGSSPCIYVFGQRVSGSGDEWIVDSLSIASAVDPPVVLPPRMISQKCGLFPAADSAAHNRAADSVISIIDLSAYRFGGLLSDGYVFPGPETDSLFGRLLRTQPEPEGLERFGH